MNLITYKEFIDVIVAVRGYHKNFNKKISGYEIHHILPRCMGGKNNTCNLVPLTVAEHLMAHTLLFRENPNNKRLLTALYHMSNEIEINTLLNVVDNKDLFEELVKDICKAKELYNVCGENNPMYNKHHTDNSRQKMSKLKIGLYDGEKNPMYGKRHSEKMKKDLSENRKGANNPKARKVYCIELDMIFDTAKEALEYVGITNGITQCCSKKYKRKTAGKHPITHEKLHWMYLDEYNI